MMRTPLGDDRRVGDDASFYPVPWRLTILISPPTPAPYRYTGLGLVRLIIRSSSCIRPHKQKPRHLPGLQSCQSSNAQDQQDEKSLLHCCATVKPHLQSKCLLFAEYSQNH